ncbi:MAG TPA: class I SAM-dependent methyltransferase [Candidatus Angelobacter sp.]|jgi:SAM-dependent methyltransferase|nr:class I SAM-dependent methyltransferase [Candidatus Angelobacter sp.]
MKQQNDAWGSALMAAYRGIGNTFEIVERDDRLITASILSPRYFYDYPKWTKREQKAMRLVKGRVLDIGCGAGRHGLYLQKKGFDVTGIDNSSQVLEVCKLRGYRKTKLMSITEIHKFKAGSFDTVIMLGNNFGLFGGFNRARRLLKTMHRITSAEGQIIAEAANPYSTTKFSHRDYHRVNRTKGRMAGQLRLRIRHEKIVGPWFDYLFVSQAEMKTILIGTDWHVKQFYADQGPSYMVLIAKQK